MYITNITFMVEHDVNALWLDTLKKHFFEALRTAGYDKLLFCKVLSNSTESHFTYSLQITADSTACFQDITSRLMPDYAATIIEAFLDKVQFFVSLLKPVE